MTTKKKTSLGFPCIPNKKSVKFPTWNQQKPPNKVLGFTRHSIWSKERRKRRRHLGFPRVPNKTSIVFYTALNMNNRKRKIKSSTEAPSFCGLGTLWSTDFWSWWLSLPLPALVRALTTKLIRWRSLQGGRAHINRAWKKKSFFSGEKKIWIHQKKKKSNLFW